MQDSYDIVNNPKHYTIRGLENETLDIILALIEHNNLSGKDGAIYYNILKYLIRFNNKNGIEDLRKSEFYLKKLIKEIGQRNEWLFL